MTMNASAARYALRLRGIQESEILEDDAALLRRESRQLFPRRVAHAGGGARRAGSQEPRQVHAVACRRTAHAVLLLIGLLTGQRAAGVEQPSVEPFLTFDGAPIEPARFELARQLARLRRQRAGGARRP